MQLQPVVAGEIRVAKPGDDGMTDTVVIAKAAQTCEQLLPHDFADSRLLVVTLDQGSIGVDGTVATANSKG